MSLQDRLHCPHCQGRLSAASPHEIRCSVCDRTFGVADGIVDLAGGLLPLPAGADRFRGLLRENGLAAPNLAARIKEAAAERWPSGLGDVIEFGCGIGLMTEAVVTHELFRGMLVLDSDLAALRTCQMRVAAAVAGPAADRPVYFAAAGGNQNVVRDAVADTVIGTALLSGIADVRGFLATVLRVLKPGGRSLFVVPNRRFHQVFCMAMAEALTLRYTRDSVWPEGQEPVLGLLAQTRRLLLHRNDKDLLALLDEKHLFASEGLEALGKEIGFATAETLPLDPDPSGGTTFARMCQEAGAADGFARDFAPLAASMGEGLLNLLGNQDSSALHLLWLTKADGPAVRIYSGRPAAPKVAFTTPDTALGGVMPRWSIELLAHDTPDGIVVQTGGWCLSNIDALWVRITIGEVMRATPVWWYRPDVHEVLNRGRVYHALNTLCSGLNDAVLFPGVHPEGDSCALRLDVMLSGGIVVTGGTPDRLVMGEPAVIAH